MASQIVRQVVPPFCTPPSTFRFPWLTPARTTMQINEREAYCEHRGWQVHDICDYPGKKDSKPLLTRIIQNAHQRHLVSHRLHAIENFNGLGIEFVSPLGQVNTSTASGRLLFTLLGAVAERHRSLLSGCYTL